MQGSGNVGYHNAIFINDHGVGVVATATDGLVIVAGGIVYQENHFGCGIVGFDITGGFIAQRIGVNSHHNHGIGIVFSDLVEVRQLLDTGTAPGAPEVDDGDLAGGGGIKGVLGDGIGGHDGQGAAGQFLTNGVAHGNVIVAGIGCGDVGLFGQISGGVPGVYQSADQGCRQDRQGDDAVDQPFLFQLCLGSGGIRSSFLGGDLIGLQQDLGTLPGDGLGGADVDTFTAGDAFLIAYVLDIYLTLGNTEVTMGAFFFVHLHAEEGDLVKQAVQTAQGTNKTAENAIDKYGGHHDADHQQEFPGEQGAQHREEAIVEFVGKQEQATFDGAGGADVFTECRGRNIAQSICNGNYQHEEHKDRVFQEGKDPGNGAFLHFGRFDLIQQVLDQTEGTQPAADHSAEHNGVQQQNTANIEDGRRVVIKRALQAAQGAGTDGTGAGVAVDTGGAHKFGTLGVIIDLAGNETLYIGIEQQGKVKLHQTPLGGLILIDKLFDLAHMITPIQYIRYR